MSKSNLMAAVFILGVVALTVEGYYVYRFYEVYRSPDSTQTALVEPSESEPETAAAFYDVFLHRAEPDNISANSTYLDNPALNRNPDAVIFVTQSWNPGGGAGTYNGHPVGVWYDANRERWAIFNQDREDMPRRAAFHVAISGESAER
jgi:hypothetical protein